MSKEVFSALLPLLTAEVIGKICAAYRVNEEDAISSFFDSSVYQNLEREETKVWQYSADRIFELYRLEADQGITELPEY